MSDLTFKVLDEQSNSYTNETSLLINKSDCQLNFQINSPDVDRLRVVFPVWIPGSDVNKNIKEELCLFSEDDWDNFSSYQDDGATETFVKIEPDEGLGALEITDITKGQTFDFHLSGFTTNGETGTASCWLEQLVSTPGPPGRPPVSSWVKQDPSIITVSKKQTALIPEITFFKAQRSVFAVNQQVQLSWGANNADQFQIDDGPFITQTNANISLQNELGEIKIKLKAKNNTYPDPVEKTLTIEVVNKSSLGLLGNFFDDQYDSSGKPIYNNIVTGIYPYQGNLYAIVLNKNQGKAYLYVSESGLYAWTQVFTYGNKPIEIDPKLATSPGIVFKDQLWLIGGSTFDPDQTGKDFGYFDFKLSQWKSSEDIFPANSIPSLFSPRMGHNCLVLGDEIYLIGGYHPNKGTLNEVWTSRNGFSWTKANISLPDGGRCMMGATVYKNKIWIGGGYKNQPGGVNAFTDLYEFNGSSFSNTGITTGKDVEAILSLDLAATDSDLFLFSTIVENGRAMDYISNVRVGNNKGLGEPLGGDFKMRADFEFHLQATAFNSGIFLRKLQLAAPSDKGIKGDSVSYFFYAG